MPGAAVLEPQEPLTTTMHRYAAGISSAKRNPETQLGGMQPRPSSSTTTRLAARCRRPLRSTTAHPATATRLAAPREQLARQHGLNSGSNSSLSSNDVLICSSLSESLSGGKLSRDGALGSSALGNTLGGARSAPTARARQQLTQQHIQQRLAQQRCRQLA